MGTGAMVITVVLTCLALTIATSLSVAASLLGIPRTAIDTCIENILFAIGVTMFTIVSVICHLMDILGAWITELFRAFLDSKFVIRCMLMVAMVIMLIAETRPRYTNYVHMYMSPTNFCMGNFLYVAHVIIWLYYSIVLISLIACPLFCCLELTFYSPMIAMDLLSMCDCTNCCLGGLGEMINSFCGSGTGATGGGMPTPPSGNGLFETVAAATVTHIDPTEGTVNPTPEAPAEAPTRVNPAPTPEAPARFNPAPAPEAPARLNPAPDRTTGTRFLGHHDRLPGRRLTNVSNHSSLTGSSRRSSSLWTIPNSDLWPNRPPSDPSSDTSSEGYIVTDADM
jgi:hypothetical protein